MIKNFFKTNNIEYLEEVSLKKYNTYHIDTICAYLAFPKNKEELIIILKELTKNNIKHFILGNGSNIILSMDYYNGVVIKLDRMNKITYHGNIVIAEAGCSLIKLALDTIDKSLSGLAFATGIPGLVGASSAMNAGAYKYCMADVFVSARVLDDDLNVITLSKEDMEFSYRHSVLQKHPNWIILDATFEMTAKDPGEIRKVLDKRKERRMSTQPWNFACAGSVFRNPEEKPAWRYIDEAGLRGYEIGGAQVSPKHSNFIVNNGYASAKDILDLIRLVEKTVYDKFGVKLHKEVILVNWD